MTRTNDLLAMLLDRPDLVTEIQGLPPKALADLVGHVGLEDAGEIVALASTEQLTRVFDEDLWTGGRPGEEPRFDVARFAVWLHVMLEAGESFAAERLVQLPEELVTLALHENVLVLDADAMAVEMEDGGEEAEATEQALAECLSEEIDQYIVLARRHEGWDDLLTVLLALDRDHHAYLRRLLERCCNISADSIEEHGGLHEALTSEEMLAGDVAADRADRRAAEGHVAPSDAKAFLALARRDLAPLLTEHDPVTRAWLRERATDHRAMPARSIPRADSSVHRLLVEHGVVEDSARAPVPGAHPLAVALCELARLSPARFAERAEELAFLANALGAGQSLDHRQMRPIEAVRVAIAVVEHGLELASRKGRRPTAPVSVLDEATADALFRLAWADLHAAGDAAVEAFLERAARDT